MAHPDFAREVYEYVKGNCAQPELETITRLAEEPEILALVDAHGTAKLKSIAETIRDIQKENKYQRGYRKVTIKQRIAIAKGLLEVISFDDLMNSAYDGIEISQTHNTTK